MTLLLSVSYLCRVTYTGDSSNTTQALAALQASLARAEGEAARLRAAIDALQQSAANEVVPLTTARAAAYILFANGAPLHVNQILERLATYGYVTGNPQEFRANLVTTLDRKTVGEQPWFQKVAPATYYLTVVGLTVAGNVGRHG